MSPVHCQAYNYEITIRIMHDMPHKDNFTAPCGSASTNANIGILNSFHSLRISNLVLTSGKPLPCY